MPAPKRFTYQQRDPATIKQRANQRGSDFDSIWKEGVKLFKPRDGKNTIRILPPTWNEPSHHGYDIYVNYGIGVNEQAYLSLSEMKKERDPLAEARKKAERSGDKDLADSLKPSKRVAMYVIDRNAEEEGPMVWPAAWTIDKSFCNLCIDEDTGESLMIDDPENGCDIRFYKEGTGMTTKYPADRMRILKPSKLSEDEGLADEWLQQITEMPIPGCLNFYDYEHISTAFDGYVRDDKKDKTAANKGKPVTKTDDDDDEEDAKPAKTITKASTNVKSKPPVKPDPEEDEYDPETGEVQDKTQPPFDTEGEDTGSNIEKIRNRLRGRNR